MCNIPVTLPTVASFLMLYSLKCGCMVIFVWTVFRSLFYIVWLMVTFILIYMPNSKHIESKPDEEDFPYVFPSYIILIITECFVFMFAIYLGVGIYRDIAFQLQQYLICRCCAFAIEIIALVFLTYNHKYYIGWYLVFLMIVILELYSFIVVYSYYVEKVEDQEAKERADTELNFKSELSESMPPDSQETQSMPGSLYTRAPRGMPEPYSMQAPRGMPEPYSTQAPRGMPEPYSTQAPRGMPEPYSTQAPRGMPEPYSMQAPRGMPDPYCMQAPRCMPEPCCLPAPCRACTPEPCAPRCTPDAHSTPEPRDTRAGRHTRKSRNKQNML